MDQLVCMATTMDFVEEPDLKNNECNVCHPVYKNGDILSEIAWLTLQLARISLSVHQMNCLKIAM
jgi:hypothetical protein